jgi:stearoyl-CoA desaturase (delta-9 desaturase)
MSMEQTAPAEREADRIDWFAAIPFFAVHIAAVVGVVMLGWSWKGAAFAAFFYYVRMFGITAGFHRYFAHRSYKMGRVMQFLMAFLGMTSTQKGVLWWAAHHRHHHKFSDKVEDIHSMKLRGFLWSHVGWILARTYNETEWDQIKDFAKYPELRFLNRFHRDRRAVGTRVGLLRLHLVPLARHLLRELACPLARQPPLRNHRREQEQSHDRASHDG